MVWTDPGSLSTASLARTHGGGKHTVTATARGARQAASARPGGAGTDAAADDGSPRLRRHLRRPGQGPRREPPGQGEGLSHRAPRCSSTAATTPSSPPSPAHGEHSGSGLSQDTIRDQPAGDGPLPQGHRKGSTDVNGGTGTKVPGAQPERPHGGRRSALQSPATQHRHEPAPAQVVLLTLCARGSGAGGEYLHESHR